MYRFWKPIVEPLFERLDPRVIVEVGSDNGYNTRNLIDYARRTGAVVHVVDPLPKYDVDEWLAEYSGHMVFHRAPSLEVLGSVAAPDVVLIDGDHNWHTVFNELRALEGARQPDDAYPVVMFHDVGWPYGRRDLYYEPSRIPSPDRQPYRQLGMRPGQRGLEPEGGLNPHLHNAEMEGGPRNGVLTAVEDFMSETSVGLRFVMIPGINGFGILFPDTLEESAPAATTFLNELQSNKALLHVLETVEESRLEAFIESSERRVEGERLRRDVASSDSEKSALRERLDGITQGYDRARHEAAQMRQTRAAERERAELAIRELDRIRSILGSREREVSRLRVSVSQATKRLSETSRALSRSERRVSAIEHSTAWKLTAPVRFAADAIKKPFRRVQASGPREVAEDSTEMSIQRMRSTFNEELDALTREELRTHRGENDQLQDVLVSVILPTRNRADVLPCAIQSVLDQVHKTWELLVIDDGSIDETENVVEELSHDHRIKYVKTEPEGVGAARSIGLSLAQGEVIAYLDSDNTWDPEFLSLALAGMDREEADVVYSAVKMIDGDEVAGYRGDVFDYKACLEANYIDINALCHRREAIDQGLKFDPKIRRTNDWDMILALTHGQKVSYLPFVGVTYSVDDRRGRISSSEPYIYRKIVAARHRDRLDSESPLAPFDEVLAKLPLSFGIRIAAPPDKRDLWGDYHFAVGLAQAFERLGHRAHVYLRHEEIKELQHDVVIVLRGLERYTPVPQALNVLWSISHPDLLSHDEMRRFDIVAVASESYQRMLSHTLGEGVVCLRQATDRARFFPHASPERDEALLFVGNSRKVERPSVRLAVQSGLPLSIYGSQWDGMVPAEVIKGEYLPNQAASAAYARAAAVLNDHWTSMKDFGYISNRVYDVLASGATLLSDHFPELEREFGDVVALYRNDMEFVDAAHAALEGGRRGSEETALAVINEHSFDNRAGELVEHIYAFLGAEVELASPATHLTRTSKPPTSEIRIGIVPQMPDGKRWTSSAYVRLFLPLTADAHGPVPSLKVIAPDQVTESDQLKGIDCLVVSRSALPTARDAERLVAHLERRSIPLVVDTDDAFHLMDDSHPQYADYAQSVEALDILIENAAETWCSTPALQRELDLRFGIHAVLVPNSIDPRVWRRYRDRRPALRGKEIVEILYFGSTTHRPDLELIAPALDELHTRYPGRFRLHVVGVAIDLPDRPWIGRIDPPRAAYPEFGRWMRDKAADFDLALAPLADTSFNRLKSDIKALEYTAMGLPAVVSDLDPYEGVDWFDRCSSIDDWAGVLSELISEPFAIDERRTVVEKQEELMWSERRSSLVGEQMARRVTSLLGT